MPTMLLLIRHAANDAVGRWLAGTSAVRLNEEGQAQAARLVDRLSAVSLDAIYSSPVPRALETAAPLAAARGLSVRTLDEATEFRMGGWDGRSFEELNGDPLWHRFNALRSLTRPPGGETMLDVQARFVSGLQRVAEAHAGGAAAVFGHADPIRAAIVHFAGMPIDLFHRLEIAPASVTAIALNERGPAILKVNDTGDLTDLARR